MGLDAPAKRRCTCPRRRWNYNEWFSRWVTSPYALRSSRRVWSRPCGAKSTPLTRRSPSRTRRRWRRFWAKEASPRRVGMTLLAVFAALAPALASLGLYGALSSSGRTAHAGDRRPPRARRAAALDTRARAVWREGLAPSGVEVGLVGAFALTQSMRRASSSRSRRQTL